MKSKLFTVALALFLMSCSTDDKPTPTPQLVDKCGNVTDITPIQISTINGIITKYRINVLFKDNTTTYILIDDGDYYTVGQYVCRNDW